MCRFNLFVNCQNTHGAFVAIYIAQFFNNLHICILYRFTFIPKKLQMWLLVCIMILTTLNLKFGPLSMFNVNNLKCTATNSLKTPRYGIHAVKNRTTLSYLLGWSPITQSSNIMSNYLTTPTIAYRTQENTVTVTSLCLNQC